MVEKKYQQRMEQEKLQGFNLSTYKVELQNDIGHLKRKLQDLLNANDRHRVTEIEIALEEVERNLEKVNKAILD